MSIRIDYQEYAATTVDPKYVKANADQDTEGDTATAYSVSELQSSNTNSNVSTGVGGTSPFPTSKPCYSYGNKPLTITMDFVDGDNNPVGVYARGITLGFDDEDNYATVVTITLKRGEITQSATIYPQSPKIEYYALSSLGLTIAYYQIIIQFTHCVAARTQCVVSTLYPGRVSSWTGENLVSFPVITQECSPVGMELPYSTSEFTLRITGERPRFRRWDKLFIYHGTTLVAKHYVDKVERDGKLFKVKGFDVLGVLDDMPFDGMYFNDAVIITDAIRTAITNCDDAPLIAPLNIQSTLTYEYYKGFIPACTRREALHRVAEACHSPMYVDASGAIKVMALPLPSAGATLRNQYLFEGSSVEHLSPYTACEYSAYSYVRDTETNEDIKIYEHAWPEDATVRIRFEKPTRLSYYQPAEDRFSISAISYGGNSIATTKLAAWVDITVLDDSNPVVIYGMRYKEEEAILRDEYGAYTDNDVAENVLRVSGNTFQINAPESIGSALRNYYDPRKYSDKWTGKLVYTAFGNTGVIPGGPYKIAIPGKGTMQGWLTKAVTTLTEQNRYVEATITGIFTEETA